MFRGAALRLHRCSLKSSKAERLFSIVNVVFEKRTPIIPSPSPMHISSFPTYQSPSQFFKMDRTARSCEQGALLFSISSNETTDRATASRKTSRNEFKDETKIGRKKTNTIHHIRQENVVKSEVQAGDFNKSNKTQAKSREPPIIDSVMETTKILLERAVTSKRDDDWEALKIHLKSQSKNIPIPTSIRTHILRTCAQQVSSGSIKRFRKLNSATTKKLVNAPAPQLVRWLVSGDAGVNTGAMTSVLSLTPEEVNLGIECLAKLGDCESAIRLIQNNHSRSCLSSSKHSFFTTNCSDNEQQGYRNVPSSSAFRAVLNSMVTFQRIDEATSMISIMESDWGIPPTPDLLLIPLMEMSRLPPSNGAYQKPARSMLHILDKYLSSHKDQWSTHKSSSKTLKDVYACFNATIRIFSKSELWDEAFECSKMVPAKIRLSSLGQSLSTLYPDTLSPPTTIVCQAEDCDVKFATYVVTQAAHHNDWKAVRALHEKLAGSKKYTDRHKKAFEAFSVPYFRAVVKGFRQNRDWDALVRLRDLMADKHAARFAKDIAEDIIFACERIDAIDEGVTLLDDLDRRGHRLRSEIGMAAAVRVLERADSASSRAVYVINHWINDFSYQHVGPPGFDTFESAVRACIADNNIKLLKHVIDQRNSIYPGRAAEATARQDVSIGSYALPERAKAGGNLF